MTPARIQLSRRKGFNLQAVSMALNGLPCVVVSRPSKWGNPFVIGLDGTAAECVHWYGLLMSGHVNLTAKASFKAQKGARAHALAHFSDLAGKNLACWCRRGQPCHVDFLLGAKLMSRVSGPNA